MPTYTMLIGWAAVDKLKQEFLNLNTILGREAEARRLVDYWNEKLGWVETLVGRVPEKKRKMVYYTRKTPCPLRSLGKARHASSSPRRRTNRAAQLPGPVDQHADADDGLRADARRYFPSQPAGRAGGPATGRADRRPLARGDPYPALFHSLPIRSARSACAFCETDS